MRGPETERLLQAVRAAVVEARRGGVTVRACIWDATVAAVDGESHTWPSKEARHTAEGACRAVDPPTVMADPTAPEAGRAAPVRLESCSCCGGGPMVPQSGNRTATGRALCIPCANGTCGCPIADQGETAEPADSLRERYAAAIVAGGGCVDLAAATSAVLAVRDAELARLRAQVAAARAFAVEMRGYCSPHGSPPCTRTASTSGWTRRLPGWLSSRTWTGHAGE